MGVGDLAEFQVAGKTLLSLGLVRDAEGNLSTFDGARLRITRTGARLAELTDGDILEGTLDDPPEGASSDLGEHLKLYRQQNARAVVHAHPAGSMPQGWTEGERHGVYTFGLSLDSAVATAVQVSREGMFSPGAILSLVRPVKFASLERTLVDDRYIERLHALAILDQTRLPGEIAALTCRTPEEVADAIRRMAIRGAPVLGMAAAYALALAAGASAAVDREGLVADLEAGGRVLIETRPTAVSIRGAVERILGRVLQASGAGDVEGLRQIVLDEARAIEREDAEACSAIGRFGQELVPEGANVLTHCNTGALCTAGIGTAMGVIWRAHLQGKGIHVWVDETRPVWQGARLTAWELQRLDVPMTLIADGAAGSLMGAGRVDLVIVGADRIAANGDVANKIGTYALAVLAKHHRIPFIVAAPTPTIDPRCASGADIAIEERDPSEVTEPLGLRIAPEGVAAVNPAFDVTPASLVTAIVTERGIVRRPSTSALRRLLAPRKSR